MNIPPSKLALTVPEEVKALATNASQFELEANAFVVSTEAQFQVADTIQSQLKNEAKVINEKRLSFTRPIDALKKQWMDFFAPAVDGRTKAAGIYQSKMSAFRTEQRRIAHEAQRKAEEKLRLEREKLEAEARRKEQEATKLKSAAAIEKRMREADELRATAAVIPESVTVAVPTPQTVTSNVAEIWKAQVVDVKGFLGWLLEHPEWHTCISFKDGELNRLARQYRDQIVVPGLQIGATDSFRNKSSRG